MSDNKPIDSYSMFANVQSYLGLPLSRDMDTADLVVLGIPYDLATTGPRRNPPRASGSTNGLGQSALGRKALALEL